jgi:serine/threonine protein kinase
MRRTPTVPPELPGLEYGRLLGGGGFSDVFLYQQKLPRRQVAVKVLLTDGLDTAARKSFVDEANLMAQLSAHPYIVTIFHADVAPDDRPYFVMEYCSGPSLAELYKRERFGVADALRTGVRLSSAIATAHAAGILHRDIKPANVLTNDFGWPALTDFGISSTLDDDLPVHTTTMGDIGETGTSGTTESQSVGMSVPWSPPEMFGDDPRPDVRSDVFSLAATIYTLLAGRTPFEIPGRSNGTLDLIGRIERGAITPLSRDDVPRSLVGVLQKGMATRRSERYGSAIEFARALQRVELELGYAPTTIEVPNLVVRERDQDDRGAEGDDETRVRSVATIDAQAPAVSPAPIGAPPASTDADETRARPITVIAGPPAAVAPSEVQEGTVLRSSLPAETVMRPVRTVEPEAEADAAQPPLAPAEPRAKTPLARILVIAVVVVVAIAVATGVIFSGAGVRNQARPSTPPKADGGSAVISGLLPTPVLAGSTANNANTSVTFRWKNPDPVKGDTYRWALAEEPDNSKSLTASSVTVKRTGKGARVCINVWVQRSGQTSPTPLKACNPK